jgi:hypothetical protein
MKENREKMVNLQQKYTGTIILQSELLSVHDPPESDGPVGATSDRQPVPNQKSVSTGAVVHAH